MTPNAEGLPTVPVAARFNYRDPGRSYRLLALTFSALLLLAEEPL